MNTKAFTYTTETGNVVTIVIESRPAGATIDEHVRSIAIDGKELGGWDLTNEVSRVLADVVCGRAKLEPIVEPIAFTLDEFRGTREFVADLSEHVETFAKGTNGYRYRTHAADKFGVLIARARGDKFECDAWGESFSGTLSHVERKLHAAALKTCFDKHGHPYAY